MLRSYRDKEVVSVFVFVRHIGARTYSLFAGASKHRTLVQLFYYLFLTLAQHNV
jgi:hypothetical protein